MGEEKSSYTKLFRNSLVGLGIAAAGTSALVPLSTLPKTAETRRSVQQQQLLPRATLILLGGCAEIGSKLPEVALEKVGIAPEKLEKLDELHGKLSPGEIEKLAKAADCHGIFAEINAHRPFEGKTVVCVTSAAATREGVADPQKAEHHAMLDRIFFKLMGAANVVTIATKDEADAEGIADIIKDKNTWGVYFDGGWQSILWDQFFDTKAFDAVRDCYMNKRGFTVAGNSAGAAVMAGEGRMIKGWNDDDTTAAMGSGFGFLQNTIVDTHLHKAGSLKRLGRLQKAVNLHPGCIGIGLDERTGLMVCGNDARVIGHQNVWILDEKTRDHSAEQLEEVPAFSRRNPFITLRNYAQNVAAGGRGGL